VAVVAACSLLQWWGHKATVTRNGKWELLAKVLAGDAYVFEHMRAFKRGPKPVIAKLRSKNGTVLVLHRARSPSSE
jgi:hypothetical protein